MVNLARGRECFVGLSTRTLLVYALQAVHTIHNTIQYAVLRAYSQIKNRHSAAVAIAISKPNLLYLKRFLIFSAVSQEFKFLWFKMNINYPYRVRFVLVYIGNDRFKKI